MLSGILIVSSPSCSGNRNQEKISATQTSASPTPAALQLDQALTPTDAAPEEPTPSPAEPLSAQRGRATATSRPTRPPASPTPTPEKPHLAATPFTYPDQAISPENISRLVELARWGHGEIYQTLWSPDGRLLAVACATGIYFYDRQTLEQVGWIDAKTDASTALAFSPDGTKLAIVSITATASLWQISEGKPLQTFPELQWKPGSRLMLSPDGNFLIVFSPSDVAVWRIADRSLVLQTAGFLEASALSPDGASLAITRENNLVLYQLASGSMQYAQQLAGRPTSLTYAPDGSTLALSMFDRTLGAWTIQIRQAQDGSALQTLQLSIQTSAESSLLEKDLLHLAYAPGGATLAAWLEKRPAIQVWRTNDWRSILRIQDRQIAFSPDGAQLASWSYDHPTLRVWRLAEGRLVYSLSDHAFGVHKAIFSPDATVLASVDGAGILRLRAAANGALIQTLGKVASNQSQIIFSPGAAPDATEPAFAMLDADGRLAIRRTSDGSLLKTLQEPASAIDQLTFSPDGQFLVYHTDSGEGCRLRTADGGLDGCFSLDYGKIVQAISPEGTIAFSLQPEWDVTQGNPFWLLDIANPEQDIKLTLPFSLTMSTFSSDGKTLFLGSPHGAIVQYNARDGNPVRRFSLDLQSAMGQANQIEKLFLSPNGKYLVSLASDHSMHVWKGSDGSLQYKLELRPDNPRLVSVAFSLNGDFLAVSASGQPSGLFRLQDGSRIWQFENADGYLRQLAFVANDQILVLASQKRIQFWQIAPRKLLGSLRTPQWITSLAVSPDGRLLATVTEKGLIQIWGIPAR